MNLDFENYRFINLSRELQNCIEIERLDSSVKPEMDIRKEEILDEMAYLDARKNRSVKYTQEKPKDQGLMEKIHKLARQSLDRPLPWSYME